MPVLHTRDALGYASKFLGLLLAYVLVAGAFLGSGAYLALDVISLSDPTIGNLQEAPAVIGVILFGIGFGITILGLLALAYKFMVDVIARAIEMGTADDAGVEATAETGSTAATDERDAESSGSSGDAVPAVDEGREESPGGAQRDSHGSPSVNVEPSTVDRPSRTPSTEAGAAGSTDAHGETPGTRKTTERTDGATAASGDGDGRSDEERGPVDGPASPTGPAGSVPTSEERPEWTPPDPSEFDSPGVDRADGTDATGSLPGDGGDETTGSTDDGWTTTAEEDTDRTDDHTDPEAIGDDATPADEGVESFRPASDEDPLSDRLPGNDDS